jgi:hypothetical protein
VNESEIITIAKEYAKKVNRFEVEGLLREDERIDCIINRLTWMNTLSESNWRIAFDAYYEEYLKED